MTQTILCAIDISNEHGDVKVLQQAAKLAALDEAQLDVITVVPDFGMSMVGSFFNKDHQAQVQSEAKARLRQIVIDTLGEEIDKSVRHLVATGNAYEEILKVATADSADLIVIGAQKTEISDYLLGPNAARVVRHSACSVFVVR